MTISTMEFSLNVFTEFSEFSDKKINKKPEGFMQSCKILLSKNRISQLVLSLVRLCEICLNKLA